MNDMKSIKCNNICSSNIAAVCSDRYIHHTDDCTINSKFYFNLMDEMWYIFMNIFHSEEFENKNFYLPFSGLDVCELPTQATKMKESRSSLMFLHLFPRLYYAKIHVFKRIFRWKVVELQKLESIRNIVQ